MKPTSPLLPGTFNSRDVGGLQAFGGLVRPRLLLRSDAPLTLGDEGRSVLQQLAPVTAIDLRERVERELDRADLDGLGLNYRSQPILGDAFEIRDMSMEEVYVHLLEQRGEQLTGAVRILAEPGALPALVFCSAGKDRTGLVIALTLGALGVSDDAIVADYTRSEQNMNGAFRAAVEARARAAGITEQELAVKVGAPPSLMRMTLAWLRSHSGGAPGYLRRYGMTNAELDRLRGSLVNSSSASAANAA